MNELLALLFILNTDLSYNKDIQPIFKNRCIQCHNGQNSLPNWMDYKTAYNKRDLIKLRVWTNRTMPIGPITEKERIKIRDWVNQGAKE